MLEGNIIMHGLREEEWELDSNRRERIYHAIASTVDAEDRRARLDIARSIPIRSSRRLGKYKTGKNQPILIAFEKKAHADILFESKSWLPCRVYKDREYTQEVENKCKLLRPILKLARSIEKYQGKCMLEEDHLVILGTAYTVEDLHKLPNDLSRFHASSKMDNSNSVLAFFGELSPFSNFHKSPFEYNSQEYHCSEQFIQEQKALLFNDTATAEQIMISTTALECKEKGKEIKGFREDIWKQKAEHMCFPGILAKFESNKCLADMLLSTCGKEIVEATYDNMWGTGVPLHQKDCVDKKKWKQVGLLGSILMKVHDRLSTMSDNDTSMIDTGIAHQQWCK